MLKKFRNEKYKNDLTIHVGDFLESLLRDANVSGINGAHHLGVTSIDSVLKGGMNAVAGDCDHANPHKA